MPLRRLAIALALFAALGACGGGGSGPVATNVDPGSQPTPSAVQDTSQNAAADPTPMNTGNKWVYWNDDQIATTFVVTAGVAGTGSVTLDKLTTTYTFGASSTNAAQQKFVKLANRIDMIDPELADNFPGTSSQYPLFKLPLSIGDEQFQYEVTDKLHFDFDSDNLPDDLVFRSVSKVLRKETVNLPLGRFEDATVVETTTEYTFQSGQYKGQTFALDRLTEWYVLGIGRVQYREQEFGGPVNIYSSDMTFRLVQYQVAGKSQTLPFMATFKEPSRFDSNGWLSGPPRRVEVTFTLPPPGFSSSNTAMTLISPTGVALPGIVQNRDTSTLAFFPEGGFIPDGDWTISFSDEIKSITGDKVANGPIRFSSDFTGPVITSASLSDGSSNVPVNMEVTVTFSEPIAGPTGFDIRNSIKLFHNDPVSGGLVPVEMDVASAGPRVFVLKSKAALLRGANYRLTTSSYSVFDALGNSSAPYLYVSFNTEP